MEKKEIKKMFSRLGLGLGLLMVIQQVSVIFIDTAILLIAPEIGDAAWYNWVLSYIPLYFIAFPICLLILKTTPDHNFRITDETKKYSFAQVLCLFAICLGILYPVNFLSLVLSNFIAELKGSEVINPLEVVTQNSGIWINLVFLVFIAPVMEEIIFRKITYQKLAPFGGSVYILTSSFMFAMFHINIYQMFYAFALGALFASITYQTQTIRYSIILHMLVNFFGGAAAPFLVLLESELILILWGLLIFAMVVTGIVLGFVWLFRKRKCPIKRPSYLKIPKHFIILNPGMLFFILLTGFMTFLNAYFPPV